MGTVTQLFDGLKNAITGAGTRRDPRAASTYGVAIALTQQDIDDVRACSNVLRKLAGSLTLREAKAVLADTCIKIEVEKAGLTDGAA